MYTVHDAYVHYINRKHLLSVFFKNQCEDSTKMLLKDYVGRPWVDQKWFVKINLGIQVLQN